MVDFISTELAMTGYNLRHGSKAGDDSTDAMQVVPLAHTSDSCEDDPRAYCDAITDKCAFLNPLKNRRV